MVYERVESKFTSEFIREVSSQYDNLVELVRLYYAGTGTCKKAENDGAQMNMTAGDGDLYKWVISGKHR